MNIRCIVLLLLQGLLLNSGSSIIPLYGQALDYDQSEYRRIKDSILNDEDALAALNGNTALEAIVSEKWVIIDSLCVAKFAEKRKADSEHLLSLFTGDSLSIKDLGFGYHYATGWFGLFYNMALYRNTSLVSYQIYPILTNHSLEREDRLVARYQAFCNLYLPKDSAGNFASIDWNVATSSLPLNSNYNYSVPAVIEQDVNFLMSPFSGQEYGFQIYSDNPDFPSNQQLFYKIEPYLTAKTCEKMLYSINPATRLMAIEYYQYHKQFSKKKLWTSKQCAQIDLWIEKVYQTFPSILKLREENIIRQPVQVIISESIARRLREKE